MNVESAEFKNFKSIGELKIEPHGNHVFLFGKNGVGKSTVIQGIFTALTGKEVPPEAIKQGEKEGSISVIVGDEKAKWQVDLFFKADGKRKLEVRPIIDEKLQKPMSGPRDFLDSIIGQITFDPFEFLGWKADKQVKFVKDLCNINWDHLDKDYDETYDLREQLGREIKTIDGAVKAADIQEHEYKLFAEKKPVEDVKKEIQGVSDNNKKHHELAGQLKSCKDRIEAGRKTIGESKKTLELYQQLVEFYEPIAVPIIQANEKIFPLRDQHRDNVRVENMANAVVNILQEKDHLEWGYREIRTRCCPACRRTTGITGSL